MKAHQPSYIRVSWKRRTLVITLLLVIAIGAFLIPATAQSASQVRVVFINVGQGDSIWIHDQENRDVLVDGGPLSAGPTVVAYLQSQAIDDIDLLVLTHGDADHVAGLIHVLRSSIPIQAVADSGQTCSTDTCQTLTAEMVKRGLTPTPLTAGQSLEMGLLKIHVLNPQVLLSGNDNDDSVVLRIEHDQVRFLLTGDISATAENRIMSAGLPLQAQVLKVAHHGSKYSSSATFLATVQPQVAVISVGSNSYGHPAPETLQRLSDSGAQVLRTDQSGTIVLLSDGNTFWIAQAPFQVFLPLLMRDGSSPNPLPTATPTPNVKITYIEYDPAGDDVQGEYVKIENQGGASQTLTGWSLSDRANNNYTFPPFILESGQWVLIWTKAGTNDAQNLYWGRNQAVWNNDGDCAYLKDNMGGLRSTYCYLGATP